MNVEIKYHHLRERKDLTEHIEHRLNLALDRFAQVIRRIVMHVYDLNGPRGGVDKKCLAVVQMTSGERVTYELRDTDAFSAVDRLSERLKERIRRELGKRRTKRRSDVMPIEDSSSQ